MDFITTAPAVGFAAAITFGLIASLRKGAPARSLWLLPAGLSLAFFLFSLWPASTEGAFGFWADHTESLWGNQITFDLLLAATAAFVLAIPRLRAAGMTPALWLPLIFALGSIGLLAILARLTYLEARTDIYPEPTTAPA